MMLSLIGPFFFLADVAEESSRMLSRHLENSDCVDEYLQDQLIIYMALAVRSHTIAIEFLQPSCHVHAVRRFKDFNWPIISAHTDGDSLCKGAHRFAAKLHCLRMLMNFPWRCQHHGHVCVRTA